jgi:putative oxidoreductase
VAIGLLILRVVVGGLFMGHGAQKLFGWFGGHGIRGTAGFMRSLRFRNGTVAAVAAGLAEFVGGLLLACGFLTPLAAAAIIGVMLTAVVAVHLPKGLWNTNGGAELPLAYAAAAAALAFTGPGTFSLDQVVGLDLAGIRYGVAAVVLALVAGLAALSLGRVRAPALTGAEPGHTERVAA